MMTTVNCRGGFVTFTSLSYLSVLSVEGYSGEDGEVHQISQEINQEQFGSKLLPLILKKTA